MSYKHTVLDKKETLYMAESSRQVNVMKAFVMTC